MPLNRVIIVVLCSLTSACATFPQYRTGRVPAPVQVESCLPSDPLNVTIRYGMDDKIRDVQTPRALKRAVEKIAKEANGCFASVVVSTGALTASEGIKLELDLQLHNNIFKEATVGFVSGFSGLLVPVWCTYPFTLTATASYSNGNRMDPLVLEDSVRLWMHAVFLLYPKTPGSATREMLENLVRTVFQKTDWKSLAK